MKGVLLALDTAGDTLSYALHDGRALLAEHSWRAGRQATTQLAKAIAVTLADFGGAEALGALAVSLGPGSYTGLRSGIALAQGLAAARNLPLVGIGAHATLAAACGPIHGAGAGRLWIAVAAGRGRLYARAHTWREGAWREDGPLQLWDAANLLAECQERDHIVGVGELPEMSAEPNSDEREPAMTMPPAHLYPPAAHLRRAGFLAELAWQRLRAAAKGQEARQLFPPEDIRPIYSVERASGVSRE